MVTWTAFAILAMFYTLETLWKLALHHTQVSGTSATISYAPGNAILTTIIGVIYMEGHFQISKRCAQISPKKYPWYAQTMPKKCPTYAQDMPKIYLRYPEICQWCAKDIPEICHQRIFGKDIPKICLRSQICPRYAQDIPKICQRFQKPEWLTHSLCLQHGSKRC